MSPGVIHERGVRGVCGISVRIDDGIAPPRFDGASERAECRCREDEDDTLSTFGVIGVGGSGVTDTGTL